MYKIVAMDLDETLLDDHHKICERNKKAIQSAKEKGVYIVPCSGRGPGFIDQILNELNLKQQNCYSILCNGAVIVDNEKDSLITCNPITFEDMKTLFFYGKEKNLCIQIFTVDRVYVYDADEIEKEIVKTLGNCVDFKYDDDLSILENKEIIKVMFQRRDMDYLHSLKNDILELCNHRIAVSYSSNRYMELNHTGVNKGAGLKMLADYLHIPMEETIGIGDNFNDFELIETAALGVAVANAHDKIKAVANCITISNNNEGAVGEVIEKWILKQYQHSSN